MKDICAQCHSPALVERVYNEAQAVVEATNQKILAGKTVMDALRQEGLLATNAYAQPIGFQYFDLWHYYGRTAKHGAFMGGADFVQWHGNYPIQKHLVDIRAEAEALRKEHASGR
jgi:hypothetical protein